MTIAEQMGNETFEIKRGIESNIGDHYPYVTNHFEDLDYILKAYSNGILCGTNDEGDFSPDAYAKRAEAAAIMQRLVDPSKRIHVVVKHVPVLTSPLPDGSNVSESGIVYPKGGDIGPNGKPITRDPITGVLGFGNGQKGGIYLGLKSPMSGVTIRVGSGAYDSYDNMGGDYREYNGYIFWEPEWTMIENTAREKLDREHPANSTPVGTQADIRGNIVAKGSPDAWFEVIHAFDVKIWDSIYK